MRKVFDVGTLEDGSPYIVMEYLEGHDLAAVIEKVGAIPLPEAVEYVLQVCEALAEAHWRGIVHRDLKPENLFLVERASGRFVKVLDFGISKFALSGRASSVDLEQTGTQRVMGSPYYMSPEQLRSSRSVDFRSDIWSLGAVLFELLTGVRAFPDADDFSALVIAIVQDRHRSLLDYLPSVPAGMLEIIDRCLAKARAERFESAAELAVALLPYAPSRARGTVERAVATYESTGTSPRLVVPSIPPPEKSGSRRPRERHETSSGVAVSSASRSGAHPVVVATPARSRVRTFALVGVAATLVGGVCTSMAFRSKTAPVTASPPAQTTTAPAAPASPAATAPANDTARIAISAAPAAARIFIDGAEAAANPYTAVLRRDGVSHFVRIEAAGYETKTRTFAATSDATIDVSLVPERPASAEAPRRQPAPPAARITPAAPVAAPVAAPPVAAPPVAAPPVAAPPVVTPPVAPARPASTAKRQAIDGTNPYAK